MFVRILAAAFVAAVVGGGVAFAQTMQTVEQASRAPNDTQLTVKVTVAQKLGDNLYAIEDASGRIPLDLGPVWWSLQELTVGEALTVTAEVGRGRDGMRPVELDGISVTRADGSVLNIRPAAGKPGWAGGPKVVGPKHPGYKAPIVTPTP